MGIKDIFKSHPLYSHFGYGSVFILIFVFALKTIAGEEISRLWNGFMHPVNTESFEASTHTFKQLIINGFGLINLNGTSTEMDDECDKPNNIDVFF